ncbi:MAG: T9SS C-terminal target domain-containing protein, partial [Crocinitomicaceae bacterium]|nr:T9SS C-terminal target domain-containing protein [Crocinitomicaceae bacterium]
ALGDPYDDYVGCDVMRGLGYYYNGDNFDGDNSGYKGYGYSPPAVGVDFFEGPYQDDDGIDNAYGIGLNEALNGIGYGDGIIDNERFGMRRFLYYSNTTNGANINQTDPIASSDYYNYLRGYWKDGTKFVYGGSGHISDPEADPNTPCDFMFPGTSDNLGWGTGGIIKPNWTEQTANNTPNDRRFVQSAGPFLLKPGAVNNITVGVAWARSNGGDPFTSVESLRRADDKAQALFENCFKVMDAPHAPNLEIQELNNELILYLSNPINSNNYQEKYQENDPFIVSSNPNADKTFRFQGYQIFQLASNQVALSDLSNPLKSRLVAQCDIKDNVSRIINFEFDEELGFSVPKERVNGENKGIRHSFRVTNDLFAQGQSKLVNFKKYYYMAVSYAYNNYETYNPNDPLSLNGQKMPYIASRKSAMGEVKVMEGVPHNPMPEADGTYQQISYGSTPRITRLDGYGNGNRSLEFTEVTLNTILNTGFMEDPEYEYGQGPVNIKVVDPLNLKSGYFECRFRNYTPTAPGNAADTASWVIYRYDSKGGTIQDSVSSELTIAGDNEQIIPAWGISVQIHQETYYFPSGSGNITAKSTNMIESSMTFADSSKRWLTGIKDNDAFFPTNWIRSGEYIPVTDINNAAYDCNPNVPPYLNPCNYPDESGVDPNQNYEGVLEGIIAPHRLTGYEADYMPLAYCGTFSGSSRQNASISFLPSVNIVITSDKSKWTRCPVVELGRTAGLNVGAAVPGGLRKSPSVDKNGNADGTGTGMGWFPGYAVDLESGARLYMAFGENSFLGGENGADMVWNPTDNFVSSVGIPLMGGMHPIYVFSYHQKSINAFNSSFDFPAYTPGFSEDNANNIAYQKYLEVETNNSQAKRDLYGSLTWISYPLLASGQTLLSTDVTIRLRINKEYKNFTATGANGGKPMYGWSMDEIATEVGSHDALKEGLKLINVVPNPYFAYSDYERTKLDTKVKITNLPERCTITIYNAQGTRLRHFKKDSPITYQDWNLCNEANIPVSGGVYLIHVLVPGVGEVVLKSFVAMRIPDLENL